MSAKRKITGLSLFLYKTISTPRGQNMEQQNPLRLSVYLDKNNNLCFNINGGIK